MSLFGFYVHVPFCSGDKCPYCGFYSIPYSPSLAEKITQAVLEQAIYSSFPQGDTLYLGGGTPTSLPENLLAEFILKLVDILPLSKNSEITVEANPEHISQKLVDYLAKCGVNRVSIGAQSFNKRQLLVLGRRHEPKQIDEAIKIFKKNGFPINIDLIYGVPGQSIEDWNNTLCNATNLEPEHISIYGLTYEQGTPFADALHRNMIHPVGAETERKMFERAIELLTDKGFEHYEISNLCKPGFHSRHNLKYWTNTGYIGFGPSAHSYIPGPPKWLRLAVSPDTRKFLRRVEANEYPWDSVENLGIIERATEFLMTRLRLIRGFTFNDIESDLPELDTKKFIELLSPLTSEGLLSEESRSIKIPFQNLFISNAVILKAVELISPYVESISGGIPLKN